MHRGTCRSLAVGIDKGASAMADDKVTITFENDLLTDGRGDTARLNGSVTVDYSTKSFSGSYQVKNSFMDSSGDYYGTLTEDGGTYSFTTSERFSLSYQGMTPTTVHAQYIANESDTYATSNNPGGQRDQPVSSSAVQASSDPAVCFAAGTLIRTPRGDVAIQDLAVGDLVVTSSRAHRLVRWLGHRTVECCRHSQPHAVMPVRIAAHAFAAHRPARDLLVSPGHAICVDVLGELLIPAGSLINGTTVVQEVVDTVTYWHLELDTHDVILAEGLPCESYIEMGNRGFFSEGKVVALSASPDLRLATHADFCRPFHESGALADVVRDRLVARAMESGWTLKDNSTADLHLIVDGRRLDPEVSGLSARFHVAAGAKTAWLVSGTGVPAELGLARDRRTLGVCVGSITVEDDFGCKSLSAEDGNLRVGFHDAEDGPQRWTDGRAQLPSELWNSCAGDFFLRVDLTRPALPRWVTDRDLQHGRETRSA